MRPNASEHDLELAKATDQRVLASLARIEQMSDDEIRALAQGEHPMVVEAVEAVIARRRSPQREAL